MFSFIASDAGSARLFTAGLRESICKAYSMKMHENEGVFHEDI